MKPPTIFHNRYLVGNGRWCSCCCPNGRPTKQTIRPTKLRRGCNECQGEGRIAFSAEEIVAVTVAEAQASRARAA